MTTITYVNEPHGFGVIYDDARLTCIEDPGNSCLAAALSRIDNESAASVLFTVSGCTAEEIATGITLSVLITVDETGAGSPGLGAWDWEAVTQREASRFFDRTGAAWLDVDQAYWRGFPVLQLVTTPSPNAPPPRSQEILGTLFTPEQTFTTHLVMPWDDYETWLPQGQEVMDGFFLVPLEREGRLRTGHQHATRLRITRSVEQGGSTG